MNRTRIELLATEPEDVEQLKTGLGRCPQSGRTNLDEDIRRHASWIDFVPEGHAARDIARVLDEVRRAERYSAVGFVYLTSDSIWLPSGTT
jgi:hypothetical protein